MTLDEGERRKRQECHHGQESLSFRQIGVDHISGFSPTGIQELIQGEFQGGSTERDTWRETEHDTYAAVSSRPKVQRQVEITEFNRFTNYISSDRIPKISRADAFHHAGHAQIARLNPIEIRVTGGLAVVP